MSALVFLGLAVVGSLAGSLVLWWRQRQPTSTASGISQFSRGLEALAPRRAPSPSGPALPREPDDPAIVPPLARGRHPRGALPREVDRRLVDDRPGDVSRPEHTEGRYGG